MFKFNAVTVYVSTVVEFLLSIYPYIKYNRKVTLAAQTKTFLTLASILFAYSKMITFSSMFYGIMDKRFSSLTPEYLLWNTVIINIVFFIF